MVNVTVGTYNELRRLFGPTINDDVKVKDSTLVSVVNTAGPKAAAVWRIMTDTESGKRYGKRGDIFWTPEELSKASGYDVPLVQTLLIELMKCNLLSKVTPDGKVAVA